MFTLLDTLNLTSIPNQRLSDTCIMTRRANSLITESELAGMSVLNIVAKEDVRRLKMRSHLTVSGGSSSAIAPFRSTLHAQNREGQCT